MEENATYTLTRDKAAKFYLSHFLKPKVKQLEERIEALISEFENDNECGIIIKEPKEVAVSRFDLKLSQPFSLASKKIIDIIEGC